MERIIEIGPSKVLSTMAQKTLNRKFLSQDKSRAIRRQILSYSNDAQAIYYQYDANHDSEDGKASSQEQEKSKPPSGSVPVPAIVPPPLQSKDEPTLPSPPTREPSPPRKAIEDEALSATNVAPALIAQKLKQPVDELNTSKTIRELSLGTV